MKNLVIFGKNGQISNALIHEFKNNYVNFNIIIYDSKDIDFTQIEALWNFLNNLNFPIDAIINCVGYTNVDQAEIEQEKCDLINHLAVKKIAFYCFQKNIKLIHFSTDYVFDGKGNEAFEENNANNLHPINFYGKTKLLAEHAIINSGCDYLIIRVSWVYDHRNSSKNFVNTIKNLALTNEELKIVDDQIGSPTSAEFIAKHTAKILYDIFYCNNIEYQHKFYRRILHLNNSIFISWFDFASQIIDEMLKSGIEIKTQKLTRIQTKDYNYKANRPLNSRLKTEFDFK